MSASPRRPSDRDSRVDTLLTKGLAEEVALEGRWLVAPELPAVVRELRSRGARVSIWTRHAGGGVEARPEPPDGPFDGAVVRVPRGTEATRMALHLVAARLAPDGRLMVGGANDEGIRNVAGRLREVVAEIGEAVPGNHARRVLSRGPLANGVRGQLESWAETVSVEIAGEPVTWTSWPGLFAHGRLDTGTAILLEHLPDPSGARVLDFGCGVGVIGEVLRRRGASSVDLVDRDALAVHAASRNVAGAQVHCSDGLPAGEGRWDLVVSNPPIHEGADADWSVLERLARELPARLRPGGQVLLVAQVTVPIGRLFGPTFRSVERRATTRGFAVWSLGKAGDRSGD